MTLIQPTESEIFLPKFKKYVEENSDEQPRFRAPIYRRANLKAILLVCSTYLISQLFCYYSHYITSELVHTALYKTSHFQQFVYCFGIIVGMTIIISKLASVPETKILIIGSILTIFGCCTAIAASNFVQSYHEFQNLVDKSFIIIYNLFTIFMCSVGDAFTTMGTFCYVYKSLPKSNDFGFIICVLLCISTLSQQLYQIFFSPQFLFMSSIQTILYCGVIANFMVILTFVYFVKPPSYDQPNYELLQFGFSFKENKIPKWAQFYWYMIAHTLVGLIIICQSVMFAFCNYFQDAFEQTTLKQTTTQEFMNYLKLFDILSCIAMFLLSGYIYDVINKKNRQKIQGLFFIMNFVTIATISIPHLLSLDTLYQQISYWLMLQFTSCLWEVQMNLTLLTLFSGAFRIILCFMFTFIYVVKSTMEGFKIYFKVIQCQPALSISMMCVLIVCQVFLTRKVTKIQETEE